MISALVNCICTVMPIPVWLLCCCCSVAQLCPHGLRPHGLQHSRLPCPSLSPGLCSDSCAIFLKNWVKIHMTKMYHLSYFLSIQISGIKYIYIALQPLYHLSPQLFPPTHTHFPPTFWLLCAVCRILVPWPRFELPPPVAARSPNHWTTREVPPPQLL